MDMKNNTQNSESDNNSVNIPVQEITVTNNPENDVNLPPSQEGENNKTTTHKKRFPKPASNKNPISPTVFNPNYPNKKKIVNHANPVHKKIKTNKHFHNNNLEDNTTVETIETEEQKRSYYLYQLTRAKNLNIAEFSDKYFEYKFAYKTEPTHKSKSLLYFSFLYENDLIFNYLIQNSEVAREEIKNNIQFLFSNKNPDILKCCLNHFDFINLQPADSINLFKNIAQHVFRLENTFYILEKFENLNINQKQEFISAIFEHNNIPMLKSINQFPNLKPLAVTYFEIHKDNLQMKNYELIYNHIFKEDLKDNYFFSKTSLFEDSKVEFNTNAFLQNKNYQNHSIEPTIDKEVKIPTSVTITKKSILKKIKS